MANAFDMFKKMQKLIVPDYSDYTELTMGEQFECPSDGFLWCNFHNTKDGVGTVMQISINGVSNNISLYANNFSTDTILMPLSKGDLVIYSINYTSNQNHAVRFFAVREN